MNKIYEPKPYTTKDEKSTSAMIELMRTVSIGKTEMCDMENFNVEESG